MEENKLLLSFQYLPDLVERAGGRRQIEAYMKRNGMIRKFIEGRLGLT